MAKFDFLDKDLNLDIAGAHFQRPLDSDFLELMRNGKAEAEKMQEAAAGGKLTQEEALAFAREKINALLGDPEACKKIFTSREENLEDMVDVLFFITEEAIKLQERKKDTPRYRVLKRMEQKQP